jgi:hypothetical protein
MTAANSIIDSARLLSPTAKVPPPFETQGIFDDRVIRWDLWPPYSPHLTPCDFYLWLRLSDKVFKTNLHTLEELNFNTRLEISTIFGEEPQRVINLLRLYTDFFRSGRQHFQHLFWHWRVFIILSKGYYHSVFFLFVFFCDG